LPGFSTCGEKQKSTPGCELQAQDLSCRMYSSGEKGLNDPNDFWFLVGNSKGFFPEMFLPGFFMSGSIF
jgi:hypothetical protein